MKARTHLNIALGAHEELRVSSQVAEGQVAHQCSKA